MNLYDTFVSSLFPCIHTVFFYFLFPFLSCVLTLYLLYFYFISFLIFLSFLFVEFLYPSFSSFHLSSFHFPFLSFPFLSFPFPSPVSSHLILSSLHLSFLILFSLTPLLYSAVLYPPLPRSGSLPCDRNWKQEPSSGPVLMWPSMAPTQTITLCMTSKSDAVTLRTFKFIMEMTQHINVLIYSLITWFVFGVQEHYIWEESVQAFWMAQVTSGTKVLYVLYYHY